MKRSLLMTMLGLFWAIGLSAKAELPTNWTKASEAYQDKQYAEALRLYEGFIEDGYASAALFYNMGNAYYRQDKIGLAILYYEKALKLSPRDAAVRANLDLAQSQQVDQIQALPSFFLDRWQQSLQSIFSSNTWSILGLLLLWTGVGGLIFWLLAAERTQRKRGFIIGATLLVLSIIPFYLSAGRASFERNPGTAILLEAEYGLRTAPEEESTVILPLHEGVKVAIIDRIGEWMKVQLQDGAQGWLPEEALGMI